MRKLLVNTQFPDAVKALLLQHQLIERNSTWMSGITLKIDYPNDVLSQEIVFWFAMAQGCGLVLDYHLEVNIKRSVHVGGSITGSTIITGHKNIVGREEQQNRGISDE